MKNTHDKLKIIVDGYIRKLALSREYRFFDYSLSDFLVEVQSDTRLPLEYDRLKVAMLIGGMFRAVPPQLSSTIIEELKYKES